MEWEIHEEYPVNLHNKVFQIYSQGDIGCFFFRQILGSPKCSMPVLYALCLYASVEKMFNSCSLKSDKIPDVLTGQHLLAVVLLHV